MMERIKESPREIYVILQGKEDPVYVKTWWKWSENRPFSRGHMRSDDARDLRMAITLPCSGRE